MPIRLDVQILHDIDIVQNLHHAASGWLELELPTIKTFGRIRIKIYAGDHNPPHVHVIGPDFAAQVAIADIEILNGFLPARNRRSVLSWIEDNRGTLLEIWDRLTGQD